MEKKVLLKKLVEEGRHIRKEFTPTAIVSDYGSRPIGEFWDANKTVDVIVNGAHAVHDTVRELDEFTEALITRLNNVKVGRIGNDETISDIKALTNAQIDKLKVGDTVIKGEHSYTVAYKSPTEMSLVYSDVWTTEEVYYEKHDGNWAHVVTDSIEPQEKLVSGQNIKTVASQSLVGEGDVPLKTIANQSIIGSGNIDIQATIKANEPFPSSWRTNGTMEQLISDINNDDSVLPGKIYLKTVTISDLPAGMLQAEMKVEVMGKQSGEYIMVFSVSSANTAPYKWEYSSYNEQHGPWRSWVPSTVEIPTVPANISYFNNDAGYLKDTIEVQPDLGHDYVDLGLPSGTLWATVNVGATTETDYGNYYKYGQGASQYDANQASYTGTENPLDSSADTAVQVWGNGWHTPTATLYNELISNTTHTWETDFNGSGINGCKFTASNGNYVFFPAAGQYKNGTLSLNGTFVMTYAANSAGSNLASCFLAGSTVCEVSNSAAYYFGLTIRPVHAYASASTLSVSAVTQAEKTAWDAKIDSTTFNALEDRVAALELAAGINQQSNPE